GFNSFNAMLRQQRKEFLRQNRPYVLAAGSTASPQSAPRSGQRGFAGFAPAALLASLAGLGAISMPVIFDFFAAASALLLIGMAWGFPGKSRVERRVEKFFKAEGNFYTESKAERALRKGNRVPLERLILNRGLSLDAQKRLLDIFITKSIEPVVTKWYSVRQFTASEILAYYKAVDSLEGVYDDPAASKELKSFIFDRMLTMGFSYHYIFGEDIDALIKRGHEHQPLYSSVYFRHWEQINRMLMRDISVLSGREESYVNSFYPRLVAALDVQARLEKAHQEGRSSENAQILRRELKRVIAMAAETWGRVLQDRGADFNAKSVVKINERLNSGDTIRNSELRMVSPESQRTEVRGSRDGGRTTSLGDPGFIKKAAMENADAVLTGPKAVDIERARRVKIAMQGGLYQLHMSNLALAGLFFMVLCSVALAAVMGAIWGMWAALVALIVSWLPIFKVIDVVSGTKPDWDNIRALYESDSAAYGDLLRAAMATHFADKDYRNDLGKFAVGALEGLGQEDRGVPVEETKAAVLAVVKKYGVSAKWAAGIRYAVGLAPWQEIEDVLPQTPELQEAQAEVERFLAEDPVKMRFEELAEREKVRVDPTVIARSVSDEAIGSAPLAQQVPRALRTASKDSFEIASPQQPPSAELRGTLDPPEAGPRQEVETRNDKEVKLLRSKVGERGAVDFKVL
ncbi:MAG: hypothetical protein AABZ44_08505, partial [Elusimicrobiota bacterium]